MIDKEILIESINKFFEEFESVQKLCTEGLEDPTKHNKENYLTYYEMSKAWVSLDNVVENELLPHIPEEKTGSN